ncbi:hypothetical protein [Streptomyces sp. NPDC098101]|uniref:hypothetical protein n=1 Tax=Streptomyces sp. NPDC098101 TaxID=3366096 RepID=UPI00381D97EF
MTPDPAPDPASDPAPDPVPSPPGFSPDGGDEDRVRGLLARAALGVAPGPVPLAAVRRAGLARRRRRAAGLSALSVLGTAATVAAVVVLTPVRPAPSVPGPGPGPDRIAAPPSTFPPPAPDPAPSSSSPRPPDPDPPLPPDPTPVRVVAPGERVDAGRGYTVWLTEEGKHWSDPDGFENFRSVVDGNIDLSDAGVSHQSEGSAAGAFHSGLYHGTRTVGRVELTDAGGRTILATLLELPGRPGWGVWYAHTGAGAGEVSVELYDRAGDRLGDGPV